MNALLSRSGTFFLMNSRSDGRINSAIIPLFGDFGFLQIWQMTGATLIGDPAADLTCSCSVVDSLLNQLEYAITNSHFIAWKNRKSLSSICMNKHTKRRNTAAKPGFRGWH